MLPSVHASYQRPWMPERSGSRPNWRRVRGNRYTFRSPITELRAEVPPSSFPLIQPSITGTLPLVARVSRVPTMFSAGTKRDHPLGCGLGRIGSSPQGAALSGRDHECNGRLLGSIRWDHLDNGGTKCERFVPVWWPLVRSIGVVGSCAASNSSLDVAALALALPAPVFIMT